MHGQIYKNNDSNNTTRSTTVVATQHRLIKQENTHAAIFSSLLEQLQAQVLSAHGIIQEAQHNNQEVQQSYQKSLSLSDN